MFIRKVSNMKTRISNCPIQILDFCPQAGGFFVYNMRSREGANFTSYEVYQIWGM